MSGLQPGPYCLRCGDRGRRREPCPDCGARYRRTGEGNDSVVYTDQLFDVPPIVRKRGAH